MAKELTDDELNIKRKARRRLIGAIVLTLAVVVILPMVLDSKPKPARQDIDLRIPASDKVSEFVPGMAASEVPETLPLAGSAVAAVSAPAAVPAVAQTVTAKPVVAAPDKQPAAAGDQKTASPVKVEPAANKQPEPKSAKPDKPDSVESYVAQVGAYSNADTAKQELEKLKKWGFKAFTEKIDDKIRVRVGPYAEREKVEKVRQLLEKHGLHPVVTSAK